MSLNIKNEETCRLAGELARLTGETMTGAITVALRERLERVGRQREPRDSEDRYRRIMEISRESAEFFRNTTGPSSTDIGEWLYDENGLPRGNGNFALTDIEVVDISQHTDPARKADGQQSGSDAPQEKDA